MGNVKNWNWNIVHFYWWRIHSRFQFANIFHGVLLHVYTISKRLFVWVSLSWSKRYYQYSWQSIYLRTRYFHFLANVRCVNFNHKKTKTYIFAFASGLSWIMLHYSNIRISIWYSNCFVGKPLISRPVHRARSSYIRNMDVFAWSLSDCISN